MKDFINKLLENKKVLIMIVIAIIVIIVFSILHSLIYNNDSSVVINNENSNEKWENIGSNSFAKKDGYIVINVVGEVNNPGVVTLEEGSRIIDAINACGGKTDKADISEINLAYVLDDGVRLYIPSYSEVKERKLDNSSNSTDAIKENAGLSNTIQESVTISTNSKQNEKININSASKEELKTLPGVGDSVANSIIEYRNKNGKFKKVEDLKQVTGIGDSKFDNMKNFITVK